VATTAFVQGELAGYQPLDGDLTDLADGSLTGSKVGSGVDAANIADGSVSNAEYQRLDGVTSGIQSQIDGKQATGNYVTALTGDVTATGPGSVAATLASVGTAGTYGNAGFFPAITTDAKGRVTGVTTNRADPNVHDITAYGANGSGTTTTVSSWNDSTHPVVASASSFSIGSPIGIDRAGAVETTGNTTAGGTDITSIASTTGFAIGDVIRVVNGQAAQAMVRQITVRVAGNEGEVVAARFNGVTYTYALGSGETVNTIATNLAAAITGDAAISASVAGAVVSVTAATPGVLFSYENIRPIVGTSGALTPRTKFSYETTAAQIPLTDVVVEITNISGTTFTVSPAVPSAVTGARIEKRHNRLITTITGISGTTLTLANAATTQATGVTVYHDAQPGIVAAVAAAGSGTVFVPPGTFHLPNNASAIAFGNASLIGAGMRKSVLKSAAWTGSAKFGWQTSANGASNILISGITFDLGQPGTSFAIRSGNGIDIGTTAATGANSNIRIQDIEVCNVTSQGIRIANAQNVWVQNNWVHDTGSSGIHLGVYDDGSTLTDTVGSNIWITDNLIERIDHIGVLVYADSVRGNQLGFHRKVHISRNALLHCSTLGVQFYAGVYDSELSGNFAEYCGGYASIYSQPSGNHGGFSLKYNQNISASGNIAANCFNGFQIAGITTAGTNGYTRTRTILFDGNIATDCQNIGVEVGSQGDGLVIQNSVVDTVISDGISVGAGNAITAYMLRDVKVLNNKITAAARGVRLSQGVYGAEIRGNSIDSCNTLESASNDRAAVSLNPNGDGAVVNGDIWIVSNRMTESRTTPANAQRCAIYAVYSTNNAVLNFARGNTSDSIVLGTGGVTALTTQNTWDGESYAGSTFTGTGGFVKQTSPALTAPTITGRTWATVSATTPTAGTIDYVTDLGVGGSHMTYTGSKWRPINGRTQLVALTNAHASIANSETIVLQTLLPANSWKVGDVLRVTMEMEKSGSTDSGLLWLRVGTAGTTSDTGVQVSVTYMAATVRSWQGFVDLKLLTSTSARKLGASSTSTGAGSGGTANPLTGVTITDASANALYVTISLASSSTADTVSMQHAAIELLTP
jgi:hypothetical protein